jgi:hypothetical protein
VLPNLTSGSVLFSKCLAHGLVAPAAREPEQIALEVGACRRCLAEFSTATGATHESPFFRFWAAPCSRCASIEIGDGVGAPAGLGAQFGSQHAELRTSRHSPDVQAVEHAQSVRSAIEREQRLDFRDTSLGAKRSMRKSPAMFGKKGQCALGVALGVQACQRIGQ